MMIRQWRKSATWPSVSVSRASSNTCRNRSQMRGCAFSNSSSRTTENGCLRTLLISEVGLAGTCRCRGWWRSIRRSGIRSCRAGSGGRPSRTDIRPRSWQARSCRCRSVPRTGTRRSAGSGSFSPALSMAMRSTTLVTASSWPITRLAKNAADGGEVDALLVVEDRDRQTGQLRQRLAARRAGAILAPFSARLAVSLSSWIAEPGKPAALRYWRAERDRHVGALRIDRRRRLAPTSGARRRAPATSVSASDCGSSRTTSKMLRSAGRICSRRATLVGVASVQTTSRPATMAGKDLIEDAGALALMGAAARELQQIGDVPDELLGDGELVDRLADAALELAEPLLAGHEIGAARLEHAPALPRDPPGKQPQERGLADQPLAAHQQRPDRPLLQGGRRRR